MEKETEQIFKKLKEDVSTYVELKVELLKLTAYERTGELVSVLSYGLILLFLAFFGAWVLFGRPFRQCCRRLCHSCIALHGAVCDNSFQ